MHSQPSSKDQRRTNNGSHDGTIKACHRRTSDGVIDGPVTGPLWWTSDGSQRFTDNFAGSVKACQTWSSDGAPEHFAKTLLAW